MKILNILFLGFVFSVSSILAFSDVSESPFETAILGLQEKSIIQGYSDGTFQPGALVNRAEFIKIIIAGNYSEDEYYQKSFIDECFDDIRDESSWYVPYACFAKEKGIIQGRSGVNLDASSNIQFVEAAKIIAKVYDNKTLSEGNIWYESYVSVLLEKKNIPADHVIQFEQNITRGIVAEMIFRASQGESDLKKYLETRRAEYNEDFYPNFKTFSKKLSGKNLTNEELQSSRLDPVQKSEEVIIENILPVEGFPSYYEVVSTAHPGEKISGSYISSYSQWTNSSYLPGVENLSLLEEEILSRRENLINLLNNDRESEGTIRMNSHEVLNEMAQSFADHLVINGIYSHMDMYGNDPFDRAEIFGYPRFLAESIKWRSSGEQNALGWWKGSELHKKNLFNNDFINIGVGVSKEPNGGFVFVVLTGK